MVRCTQCRTEVDEKRTARCPFCSAPLAADTPAITAPPLVPPLIPRQSSQTGIHIPGSSPDLAFGGRSASSQQPQQPFRVDLTGQTAPPLPATPLFGAPQQPGRVDFTGQSAPPPPGAPLFGTPHLSADGLPRPGYGAVNSPRLNTDSKYRDSSGSIKWGAVAAGVGLVLLYITIRIGVRLLVHSVVNGLDTRSGGYSSDANLNGSTGPNPHEGEMGDPISTTRAVMVSLRNQDWQRFYYLTAFENNDAKSGADASSFAGELTRDLSMEPHGRDFQELLRAMTDLQVTQTSNAGSSNVDVCDVSTSASTTLNGQHLSITGTAHLIKINGHWFLNLMAGAGRSTSTAFADLFGLGRLRSPGGGLIFPTAPGFLPPAEPNYVGNPPTPSFQQPTERFGGPGDGNNDPNRFGNQPGQPGAAGFPNGPNNMPGPPQIGGARFGPQFGPRFGPRYGPGAQPVDAPSEASGGPRNSNSAGSTGAPQEGAANQTGSGDQGDANGAGQPPPGGSSSGGQDPRGGF